MIRGLSCYKPLPSWSFTNKTFASFYVTHKKKERKKERTRGIGHQEEWEERRKSREIKQRQKETY
jgi:hypothetical protein